VSVIRRIAVLGFHRLAPGEHTALEAFFAALEIFPLLEAVTLEAIRLRQRRSMTLGDAIIAATALVHARTLATRNTGDFEEIPGLKVWDPFLDVKPTG
jgi:predicted nucleic acid-binding protein